MESENSKSELAEISKVHQAKLKEEIQKSIMDREKRLSILYQKQGRATQFANKAARDKWLQKEIDDLERVLKFDPERRTRESRAVPTPDANAELVSSLQQRTGTGSSHVGSQPDDGAVDGNVDINGRDNNSGDIDGDNNHATIL